MINSAMTQPPRSQALLELLAKGLRDTAVLQTAALLGDRREYVGMSDIARVLDCPRAAVGHKLQDGDQRVECAADCAPLLGKLLRLQRGHWFEAGVAQVLRNLHMPVLEQVEIQVMHHHVPIRAHLDFTFASTTGFPTVRILELKSCEHIPATLYASHETQVYGQVGLLSALWDQPVFGLSAHGPDSWQGVTFPEMCAKHLGIIMPDKATDVDIEAWVLCLSMSEAKAYGPYCPNDTVLRLCLAAAKQLWDSVTDVRTNGADFSSLPTALGFHALCSWCDFNADCPKFHGIDQPQWGDTLAHLAALKAGRDDLEAQIAVVEDGLKTGYRLSAAGSSWINAGEYRFRVSPQAGRRIVNKERLSLELSAALGADAADALLGRCEVTGKAFERLIIHNVNRTKEL